MKEALEMAQNDDQPFIIGGGEIYTLGMEVADKIELTRVHGTFEADAFFPEIPLDGWETIFDERHEVDERHAARWQNQDVAWVQIPVEETIREDHLEDRQHHRGRERVGVEAELLRRLGDLDAMDALHG